MKSFLNFNLPNIHTSLADVNLLKLIDSGAIHLIGSLPLEAENGIIKSNEKGCMIIIAFKYVQS